MARGREFQIVGAATANLILADIAVTKLHVPPQRWKWASGSGVTKDDSFPYLFHKLVYGPQAVQMSAVVGAFRKTSVYCNRVHNDQ